VLRNVDVIAGALENYSLLEKGEALLAALSDEAFAKTEPAFKACVGEHYRHIFDHFSCLFDALQGGLVDYSARRRVCAIERDRALALAESRRLRAVLETLDQVREHRLLLMTDGGQSRTAARTSVERELDFLASHTIHHHAIIAAMCSLHGVTPPRDFGFAPSTVRYRAEALSGACNA